MERLVSVAKKLRLEENFNGYIHLKSIPGTSDELMREAGLYADRLSVNIEIPTKSGLKLLAPDKNHEDFIKPMIKVKNEIIQYQAEKKIIKSTPKYAPAGQWNYYIRVDTKLRDLKLHKLTLNYEKKKQKLQSIV
jgi:predicted DNA-binding helix-hairpin-helix protein